MLAGGAALAGLLAVASAVAAWEFYRIARAAGHTPLSDLGCAIAGLVPIAVHARFLGIFVPRLSYLALVVLIVMSVVMWVRGASSAARPLGAMAVTTFGALYTGGMLSFGYALRYHDYAVGGASVGPITIASGALVLGLPLLLTWASDIGAFFVGRAIGGPKLMPSISPGKTRSGAVGGLVASVLVTWLYVRFLLIPIAQLGLTTAGIITFGILISAVAQVGDLVESMLKREAGVKDSSNLLPGHGGVLDRLDSLFFVLPVAYLLLEPLLLAAPR